MSERVSLRPLRIAVLVKFTVDVNQLRVDPDTGGPDLAHAPWRINDFDENAIEEAVRLKEKHTGLVAALTLTVEEPPRDIVLRALAMGLDVLHVVRRPASVCADSLHSAEALAVALRSIEREENVGAWDLVLAGDSSVDGCNGQTGPRVAEVLGVPSITGVTALGVDGVTLRAERMLEDRVETVECLLPALVTMGMEINRPRLPTVLQIMGAGRKPVRTLITGASSPRPWLGRRRLYAPPSARRREVVPGDSPAAIAENLLRRLGDCGDLTP